MGAKKSGPGESYARECPYCGTTFSSVQAFGACPECRRKSRILPDGRPLAVMERGVWGSGDPSRGIEGTVANAMASLSVGGAILIDGRRFGDEFPPLDEVHRQLIEKHILLREHMTAANPSIEYEEIDNPSRHPQWKGTEFKRAIKLQTFFWYKDQVRQDVVCELTDDGGTITVVRDHTMFD